MLITIITILLLSFLVAAFVKFVHYSIGEPHDSGTGMQFTQGRIFSAYGAFILRKHIEHDEKQLRSIQAKFKHIIANDGKGNPDFKPSDSQILKIQGQYKPSPWLALGVCPICFSFWLGAIVWAFVLFILSINLLWMLLAVPASTMILHRM